MSFMSKVPATYHPVLRPSWTLMGSHLPNDNDPTTSLATDQVDPTFPAHACLGTYQVDWPA